MDASELETYQVQLSQVEQALAADPENEELAELVSELKQLIELTKATLAQTSGADKAKAEKKAAAASAQAHSSAAAGAQHHQQGRAGKAWAAGDECLARYSGDEKWYPARITSVGGAEGNHVFSVVFRGYNTTELLKAHEIKALPASFQASSSSGSGPYGASSDLGGGAGLGAGAGSKRKLSKEEELDRERKKKKNEKKLEVRAAKAKEQNQKQASWQKFAKKSEKKGVHIAGVSGTSIFKTPDNPYGKGGPLLVVIIPPLRLARCVSTISLLTFILSVVGVTGSGQGMTENAPRPKNKFVKKDEANL